MKPWRLPYAFEMADDLGGSGSQLSLPSVFRSDTLQKDSNHAYGEGENEQMR